MEKKKSFYWKDPFWAQKKKGFAKKFHRTIPFLNKRGDKSLKKKFKQLGKRNKFPPLKKGLKKELWKP